MGKIVAIGGGEIKDAKTGKLETLLIDKEIVRLTGKAHPRALFIPTASGDAEGYVANFEYVYGKKLGCKVDVLRVVKSPPAYTEMEKKILSADIIYVGGGNTFRMIKCWRKHGIDKILRKAYDSGIVLSGLSAGAVCWFRYANSDSSKDWKHKPWAYYLRVSGLGFVPATLSVHHIREKRKRITGIRRQMQRTPGVGIALDDCCALEIVDGEYRLIASKKNVCAHKVYYKNGRTAYDKIPVKREFSPMDDLLEKA